MDAVLRGASGLVGAISAAAVAVIVILAPSALAQRAITEPAAVNAAQLYYKNPFRDVRHLRPLRIDEGEDLAGDGPVKALGPGVVTVLARGSSFFWANVTGNVVVEKLELGPLQGRRIYYAEMCIPARRLHVGEQVTTATTLCRMLNLFPETECGFAQNNRSGIPAAWPVYEFAPDGSKTAYGVDFSNLIGILGGPQGNTGKGPGAVSYRPWVTVGALPLTFPSF
jgi:hypothetical protein